MALQPGNLRLNFYDEFINQLLQPISGSFNLPRTAHYVAARHTSDPYHISNNGNDYDVMNNDDDFAILMLEMVVFEILLA